MSGEEWFGVAVPGKGDDASKLHTAIAAIEDRDDLVRPLVVLVHTSRDPGMFVHWGVGEVRQRSDVQPQDFLFLKTGVL